MHIVTRDRPTATVRPDHGQPGRMNPRERLRSAATQARIRELESDWLWAAVSPDGRKRLLYEHGLLPGMPK